VEAVASAALKSSIKMFVQVSEMVVALSMVCGLVQLSVELSK
jgi:hypothetical protein